MTTPRRGTSHDRTESGFVLVWFVVTIILLLSVAAFTIDLMHRYSVAQEAQNAADAAALAGVVSMPDEATAFARAREVAAQNIDGNASVTPVAVSSDQLEVKVTKTFDTAFAGLLGFDELSVSKTATAQYEAVVPVDLVVVLDRTSSMTAADLQNVKNASRALLQYLDPTNESVALGVLGPSGPTPCNGGGHGLGVGRVPANSSTAPPDPAGRWMASPFDTGPLWKNYQNPDGTLNVNSDIARTINCITTSSVGTDLGSPMQAALAYLQSQPAANPAHHRGIILMTDGAANEPHSLNPFNPCQYALNAATAVKNANVQVVTIGFGIENQSDTGNQCHDATGTYSGNKWVGPLLAAMSSSSIGTPSCTDAENTDDDMFFCQRSNLDLSKVFVDAASQITGRSPRLVR